MGTWNLGKTGSKGTFDHENMEPWEYRIWGTWRLENIGFGNTLAMEMDGFGNSGAFWEYWPGEHGAL